MEIKRRTRATVDPYKITIIGAMAMTVILLGLSADAYFSGNEIQKRGFIYVTEQDYIAFGITAVIAIGFIILLRRINNEKEIIE